MQNVILLAVVCVGFFYALYRVYKNSDGTEGSSGCGGNCMHCPMAGGCGSRKDEQEQTTERTVQPERTVLSFFVGTAGFHSSGLLFPAGT